jgi:hypothetical protein
MAITTTSLKNTLATSYKNAVIYAALFTTDPGATGTVVGEVTGGAYARVIITWGTITNGVVTGTATLNVPAGVTIAFAAGCTSATAGTADLLDKVAITSQNFATAGTYALTLTFTQV